MGSFMDVAKFKPLLAVQEKWPVIRAECAALNRNTILNMDRVGKTHEQVAKAVIENGKPGWVEAWGEEKDKWLNWGLLIHDTFPLGDAGVPRTVQVLRHLRGVKVAALSLFKPGLLLKVHQHPELGQEGLYSFHLGLDVPSDHCYLNVEGEFAREGNGKAIVFDGSKDHYAFNASDVDRLILYCEFSPERLRWVD